jgi:hypothetical protein
VLVNEAHLRLAHLAICFPVVAQFQILLLA